jgi:hypothetical protein
MHTRSSLFPLADVRSCCDKPFNYTQTYHELHEGFEFYPN